MYIYIDILKERSTDWLNADYYGGTHKYFDKIPKKGDIIEHLPIVTEFAKNNPKLNNVPKGSFEVLCEPFEINSNNPYGCTHKIMVCSAEL